MRQAGVQGAKSRGRKLEDHDPGRVRTALAGPRGTGLHRARPEPFVGRGLHVSATWQGPVFFSFVIDVFSRRVVGWQFASHMRTTLVLDALRMALGTRDHGADVLVAHSDAGSQYVSWDYRQTLDDHAVRGSIGSVGDAYDNAMAESFVDTFKTELIADRVWKTNSDLELAIIEYVHWFNTERLHESLADTPPEEFELKAAIQC